MQDTESTTPPAPLGPVPDFYRPERYCAEDSVGYLMRRVLNAMSQAVDGRLCKPDSPTYPQWLPLHKLHVRKAQTVAELARECMLDAGSMTRLLDRLEAKGLCRRVRSVTRLLRTAMRSEERHGRGPTPIRSGLREGCVRVSHARGPRPMPWL
jgi:hypothetical protein